MEQHLNSYKLSSQTSKNIKPKRIITIPRIIFLVVAIGVLFFGFYEAMRYFCCTRPLRKAAEAEYEVYHTENDENDDTYIKKVETSEYKGYFQLEICKSIKCPHCISLYLSEPIKIDDKECWLSVCYYPYEKLWSDSYGVNYDYTESSVMHYSGFEVDEDGRFISNSEGNSNSEHREYAEKLNKYYTPLLELLKSEYNRIMKTY